MLISTLLSLLFLTPTPVLAQVILVPTEQVQLNPTLKRICGCESAGSPDALPRQFNDDGSVLHGHINPADKGLCQINEIWNKKALALGYDLDSESGNIRMANYIFSIEGTLPWNASKSCWKK